MLLRTKSSRDDTMKNDAIGVFDSGMGGLTAVKELNAILPHENIIYFGDTARIPTAAAVRKRYSAMPKRTWRFCGSMP